MKKSLVLVVTVLIAIAHVCNASEPSFPFARLPKDMQYEVLLQYIDDQIASLPDAGDPSQLAKTLKIAAAKILDKIRDFTTVNKELNSIINQPALCFKLIKKLAHRFNAFDEEVAQALGTKCAKDRLKLQSDFLEHIRAEGKKFSSATLEDFIKKGIDLEWTNMYGETPLIVAAGYNKRATVKALINKGVNVNFVNRDGKNALYAATIMLDIYSHWTVPTRQMIKMVKMLLNAGANPRIGYLRTVAARSRLRKKVHKLIKDAQRKYAESKTVK